MRDDGLCNLPIHQRVAARIADKYVSRTGEARDPEETRHQQKKEVLILEMALENVRRGLSFSIKGKAARIALKQIETIPERDYGVHGRMRPDNQ